ncbi:hypothetical protein [Tepidimicrobium xylanilyticum]
MGLYGSPDAGNLYTKPKETKPKKKEGYKPQKNVWVWVAILIVNLIILLLVGITLSDIITLLVLDSIILFGISITSLVVNLVKKRKIGNDIKFIFISIILFIILTVILSTL